MTFRTVDRARLESGHMQPEDLNSEIGRMRGRLKAAYQRQGDDAVNADLLDEALEELGSAVEELKCAETELLSQNDRLARSQEQVEAERSRYEELFHHAPSAYFVTDGHGVVLEANRETARLLGVDASALRRKPLVVYFADEHRRDFFGLINSLSQEEQDLEPRWAADEEGKLIALTEVRIVPRFGRDFWVDMTSSSSAPPPAGWKP